MISEKDLQDAIAECQGERHPNASTCIKLAAYFTIYEHLYPKEAEQEPQAIFHKVDKIDEETVGDYGDSDFLQIIKGKNAADVWAVMDELMETIQVINQRLYDGVMRQLL